MSISTGVLVLCNTHTHTHTHTGWDPGKDVFNPQFWFPRPDYPCQESNDAKASKHM